MNLTPGVFRQWGGSSNRVRLVGRDSVKGKNWITLPPCSGSHDPSRPPPSLTDPGWVKQNLPVRIINWTYEPPPPLPLSWLRSLHGPESLTINSRSYSSRHLYRLRNRTLIPRVIFTSLQNKRIFPFFCCCVFQKQNWTVLPSLVPLLSSVSWSKDGISRKCPLTDVCHNHWDGSSVWIPLQ